MMCFDKTRTTMRKSAKLPSRSSTTTSNKSNEVISKFPQGQELPKIVKFSTKKEQLSRNVSQVRRCENKLKHLNSLLDKFNDLSFTKKIYNLWSDDYDSDMQTLHYRGPEYIAAVLKYDLKIDVTAKIIDVGCGTGLVGTELKKLQYVNIHGVDFSPEMVSKANLKDCYKTCRLLNDLGTIDEDYDVVILCCVVGRGHIPNSSVTDIASLARAKAHIIVAQLSPVENLENSQLQEFVQHLETRTKSKLSRLEPIQKFMLGRLGVMAIVNAGPKLS